MSVKIRVSYSTDAELAGVIRLLSPQIKSCKVAKKQEGEFKRAYIVMNDEGSEHFQNNTNRERTKRTNLE